MTSTQRCLLYIKWLLYVKIHKQNLIFNWNMIGGLGRN